jgi:hypothetical protein
VRARLKIFQDLLLRIKDPPDVLEKFRAAAFASELRESGSRASHEVGRLFRRQEFNHDSPFGMSGDPQKGQKRKIDPV